MATEKDIAGIVAQLSAAYPNWNVTPFTVEVYYQDLKDIPSDELMIASQHCRSEAGRKFAPSVGELRGAVMELRGYKANLPSSYQAWEEVQRQIVDNGGDYGVPVWTNQVIERAVKMIGWRNLRMSEDSTADRARFIQCYEQLVIRVERDEMLIPEVRNYLEVNGAKILAPMEQIRLLAKGMSK